MINDNSRIFDFLSEQLNQYPKPDLLCGKENGKWIKYSTAEVHNTSTLLAAGFLKLGLGGKKVEIEQKDKIAVISRNRPEWLMLDLACQQTGIILCPIYPTTHVNEIEFIFNDAAIKYVFVSGEDILDKVLSIKNKIPSLIGIYSFDILPGTDSWKLLTTNHNDEDVKKVAVISSAIDAKDCATIIYTSGTTGVPKGVMLSHRNLVSNVVNATRSFPFPVNPKGKALSFLPLNHIFERMVSYIYISTGISIYYAESLETIGDNLKEVKPNLFTTVPRLLEKVYEKIMSKGAELKGIKKNLFYWAVALAEKYDNINSKGAWYKFQLALANKIIFKKWRQALGSNIDFIITGGAACQVKLIRIFTAAGIPIYEGYGPTENSPVISVNCHKAGGTKFGTVGLPIEGQKVKLAEDGEILVKGPSVMMGYYKRPDLTSETIIDGWLHTGDIGVFEENTFLKITDRKKELFKTSGGKYVAPQAIENKLKESPFIEQIMILGSDQKYVIALIVPSFPNLKSWMRENNIALISFEEAINDPRVVLFYKNLINAFNTYFNQVEQIKKFQLLPNEWSVETGELTPKLSMKRKVIQEKYQEIIDKMYK
ncbi:MAG: long-chain fatty acid--CoA ligase [Ferruginibacter sp.]|nr:long-chain fatty acid--CoA ligase [Ferruginibacter sp.]